jgi:hypothetical protein
MIAAELRTLLVNRNGAPLYDVDVSFPDTHLRKAFPSLMTTFLSSTGEAQCVVGPAETPESVGAGSDELGIGGA